MSSIGNVSSLIASSYSGIGSARHQRPDPAEMAEDLFSRLDTTGKGYIEQSDLESALSGLTTSSSSLSSASASEIFSQLDGDGDGKITQDEMSSGISKLAQALDDQFNQSRMQGGMPPPPPPPRGGDSGFTKDELSSKLSEVGSSDPARANLLSNIVSNFDAADTDQDGKVTFQEAMAYDRANPSSGDVDTSTSSSNTEAQVFRQIMDLLRAYGASEQGNETAVDTLISSISTSA